MDTFIGTPCRRAGHTLRYTKTKSCVECHRESSVKWKQNNLARTTAKTLEWRAANPEKWAAYKISYRERHLEKVKSAIKSWQKANQPRRRALEAEREARKFKATPSWLSESDKDEIIRKYAEAAKLTIDTGVIYHVDHIVPIRGKTVSGLHVPWNLQVITAKENCSKKNKWLS